MQTFVPTDYYARFYESSLWILYLAGGVAMAAIMLAGVMFPLWPPVMRLGVSYLSFGVLGLIGLFFAIAIVSAAKATTSVEFAALTTALLRNFLEEGKPHDLLCRNCVSFRHLF